MAGGGATALMSRQGRGLPQSAALSKSAEVIVGQAVTLASGKVQALQSIEVVPCCYESGVMSCEHAVRVKLRHADAKSGGLGIEFGRYNLPYRYPAACTTDAGAVQISKVVAGSVASLRPDLRAGSVLVGVNGQRVSTMRLEQVLKELHEAEVAAGRETAGEIDEASLTLDLLHELSAPAMPPPSPQQGSNENVCAHAPQKPQARPPCPPPPFANRITDQLNDVLSEVVLEEQIAAAIRIQAVYRGVAQRLDHRISHLAATIMQAHVRGVRARKAVEAHRAALLVQEERIGPGEESAMAQLEEEQEHEPTDRSAGTRSAVDDPVVALQSDEDVERQHMDTCDDREALIQLQTKLLGLRSSAPLTPDSNLTNVTPRTLAKQLEVGGDTQFHGPMISPKPGVERGVDRHVDFMCF
jgi:hypothetical protein